MILLRGNIMIQNWYKISLKNNLILLVLQCGNCVTLYLTKALHQTFSNTHENSHTREKFCKWERVAHRDSVEYIHRIQTISLKSDNLCFVFVYLCRPICVSSSSSSSSSRRRRGRVVVVVGSWSGRGRVVGSSSGRRRRRRHCHHQIVEWLVYFLYFSYVVVGTLQIDILMQYLFLHFVPCRTLDDWTIKQSINCRLNYASLKLEVGKTRPAGGRDWIMDW